MGGKSRKVNKVDSKLIERVRAIKAKKLGKVTKSNGEEPKVEKQNGFEL